MKPSYVVSLSGGKDSTAMLLMMLERGEPVPDIVFFDGGWEFPAMYAHLKQVEKYTGRTITRLRPREPFDYTFAERPVISRVTKEVRQHGRGWPSPSRRWCTRQKQEAIHCHANALSYRHGFGLPIVQCIGFAADEAHRADRTNGGRNRAGKYTEFRYPLIEWGISERDALDYCLERGFTWDGLYKVFDRVSCMCCPLGGIGHARLLRKHYPELWEQMLRMESWLPEGHLGRRFYNEITLSDLDTRFTGEDVHEGRMNKLPGMAMEASL